MGKVSQQRGRHAEDMARDYLKSTGYDVIARNFRGGNGEIDIIARKKGVTYFVEVKARKAGSQVKSVESVTPDKKRRLKSAVMAWLAKHGRLDTDCRFMLIAIELSENERPKFEVIEDYI